MSGAPNPSGGYSGGSGSGSGYAGGGRPPPQRTFEERAAAKEQMMASVRESSQQDRRVYVGNLAYDVKWHHLKDFMRQGQSHFQLDMPRLVLIYYFSPKQLEKFSLLMSYFFRMECRRWAPLCDAAGSTGLPCFWLFLLDAGLTGWTWSTVFCRDAGKLHLESI